VRLQLQPEVSDRDFSNAVQTNGVTVPGLTTRRVNTEVEMRFGETFMLAGLISIRNTAETSKVPFLGELPWLGAAFRRVRYDEGETEVVIMVTPELVAPMAGSQVPPGAPGQFSDVPTDRELFKSGFIEVPKYGNLCDDCEPGAMAPSAPTYVPSYTPTEAPADPAAHPPIAPAPAAAEGDATTSRSLHRSGDPNWASAPTTGSGVIAAGGQSEGAPSKSVSRTGIIEPKSSSSTKPTAPKERKWLLNR
jgi:pilus assembly protein CpaC